MEIPALNDHICLGIYLTNLEIQRAYKPHLDALDLTYPQYLVLSVLVENEELTLGGLAEMLDLEPSTLTPVVKRLQAQELLTRTRNPQDERQVLISLTPKGQGLRAECTTLAPAILEGTGMTVDDVLAFNKAVRVFQTALRKSRQERG